MKKFIDYIKCNYKLIIIKTLLLAVFLALDLLTKSYFEKVDDEIVLINGVLSFTFVKNTGAAFGIFPNGSAWLVVFSVIFLIVFILYDLGNKEQNVWSRLGFVFIFAGAIGNMIDRIFYGYVRDFISFDFITFPVFNVADVLITIGCILYVIYLLQYLFYVKKNKKKKVNTTQNKKIDEIKDENDNIHNN